MRKVWSAAVVAVLALNAAGAAEPASDSPPVGPVPEAFKPLQGVWKPLSVQYDATEQIPEAKTRSMLTMVVAGNEFRTYYRSDPKGEYGFRLFTTTVALDPGSKTFSLTVTDGQKKGESRHGIYEVTGDTLKLCYGPTDKPRPTAFAAPKGSGIFFETWQIEKR